MFGHTSMLAGDPASSAVIAHEDTLLYRIAEAAIRPVLAARRRFGFVVRSLAGRSSATAPARGARGRDARPVPPAVGELVRRPAVIVSPDAAAGRGAADGGCRPSSLLVDPGERLGIVTDPDFRSRVVAAGVPPDTPVSAIMTVPARTVAADTTGSDALLEMLDRGLRHLVVLDTLPQGDRRRLRHRPDGGRAAHAVSLRSAILEAADRDDAGVGQPRSPTP